MTKLARLILAVSVLPWTLLAQENPAPASPSPSPAEEAASSGVNFEEVSASAPTVLRVLAISALTKKLVEARDRAGLEALAAQLRADKETVDNGISLLYVFYTSARALPKEDPARAETLAFFEQWAKDQPASITAQVCYANALTTGTNDPADPKLQQAWTILQAAKTLPDKCPGWYMVAQRVGIAQGWKREDFFALTDEALQTGSSGEIIMQACYFLTPRRHGQTGDFEQWINDTVNSYPPEDRDRQYARFVWLADRMPGTGDLVFGPGRLDWARTQRGLDAWLKQSPDNLVMRNEYLRLAAIADDRAKLREQLEITGPKYISSIWKKDAFAAAWNYAFNNGPRLVFRDQGGFAPELKEQARQSFVLLYRAIIGAVSGVLLLILAIQRRHILAGIVAFVASVLLAGFVDALAPLLCALALWLYLRSKPSLFADTIRDPSPWRTLAGVILLIVVFLGLQAAALLPALATLALENPAALTGPHALETLIAGTDIFRGLINAAWVTILLLLVICLPQSEASWESRLGLHSVSLSQSAIWVIAGLIGLVLLQQFGPSFLDEKTRDISAASIDAIHSPLFFLLAVLIAVPLFEELVFRGYTFSGWGSRWGAPAAVLLSSLVFALSRAYCGWSGLFAVFLAGLIFAIIRLRTGSIYPTLILHVLANIPFVLFH